MAKGSDAKQRKNKRASGNAKLAELVFIIDKSGSMSGLESDTIGGFNSVLAQNRKCDGDALVSVVIFDTDFTWLHRRVPIDNVADMSDADYIPSGCTALLDAMGDAIGYVSAEQAKIDEEDKPGKTIVVITTDGEENASHEWNAGKIKELVERKQKKEGWEFLYLGANLDAIKAAAGIGIGVSRAATYVADKTGTGKVYAGVSKATMSMRASMDCCCAEPIDESWKAEIEADTESRG